MSGRSVASLLLIVSTALLGSCRDRQVSEKTSASATPSARHGPPLGPPQSAPPPREGMAFISPGALVAGTPVNELPRIADEEMPGEQLILKGFYIDLYPYPNEEGAIPLSNVSRAEAEALCKERNKRLCTELEWERACKGPNNHKYEYGDRYRPEVCKTGSRPALIPSGLRVGCKSDFGVYDLHGGVWEWTASRWGRGVDRELYTVRGGNATAGELVGRCSNAMARPPDTRSPQVGFRCCAGPTNNAEVVLRIERGRPLEFQERLDKKLALRIFEALPQDVKAKFEGAGSFSPDRMWTWRPIGNEELTAVAGCVGKTQPECGVAVARVTLDRVKTLTWAASGYRSPSLHVDHNPRDVWLLGGDDQGTFKRLIAYHVGQLRVGHKERRVGKTKVSRKRRRRSKK